MMRVVWRAGAATDGGPKRPREPEDAGEPEKDERELDDAETEGEGDEAADDGDDLVEDEDFEASYDDAPGDGDPSELDDDAPAELVRLNKYLADHGVASRRRCDELIEGGQVTVDGETETRLGTKIDPTRQTIEIDGFVLKPQGLRKRYYLLNKPSGVVCTNEQREMRPRAVDLITDPRKGRIYTVGRLDEESKGLIVLTNDGEFAQRVMHPRFGIEKTYLVRVQGKIGDDSLQKIRNGIHLAEGRTSGARIIVFRRQRDSSWLSVTVHEGMNREIRRVFARVGFKVIELKRTRIGPVHDRGLKIGRWRPLTAQEVKLLLEGAPEAEVRDLERKSARKRPPRSFSGKRGLAPGPRPPLSGPKGAGGAAPRSFGPPRRKSGFDKRKASPFGSRRSGGPSPFGAPRGDAGGGRGGSRDGRGGSFGGGTRSGPRSDGARGDSRGGGSRGGRGEPFGGGMRGGPRADGARGGSRGGGASRGPRKPGGGRPSGPNKDRRGPPSRGKPRGGSR